MHHWGYGSLAAEPLQQPPVFLSRFEYWRLDHIAHVELGTSDPVGAFLSEELARAAVLDLCDLGSKVAAVNDRVIFRHGDSAHSQLGFLVFPEGHVPANSRSISVASATGAALIGLREGARLIRRLNHGTHVDLTLEKVVKSSEDY
jgi:transcription elongation GreA/GreB family factor